VTGVLLLVLYGFTVQDWVRRRWAELFMPGPVGLERGDTVIWKRACQAMDRGDVLAARHELSLMEPASRCSPDVALLEALLNWNDLLSSSPTQGNGALYRSAMDFYWRPSDDMSKKLFEAAAKISDNDLGDLIEGRTEIVSNLVKAVLNPASPFHPQAGSILSRITGLKFSFNAEQNWLEWWEQSKPHWSGDAGKVSLVARLIRVAPESAAALAKRVCGRAEEPLLKTLTEQVVYLTALQRAMQSREGVDAFIRQPRRLLLVPELADAVGLLHTDSPSLENLGLPLPAAMRQLKMRTRVIDYIANLWARYPSELDEDMPWLLKTLTGRSLGGRRPRANFESWWPGARESVAQHDEALAKGLVAHHEARHEDEEKAFRAALSEAPRELTSRYNLALCLERRKDFDGAKRLLKELTQLEPKEPFWWIALGTIHRTIKQSDDALAAFRKAQQLGAAASRVALQMGLTFAHDMRNDEAIQHIARWLGKNPPQSKIEALISALEDEGLWALAGHYREQAFRKGLNNDDDLETGEEQTA
jgi:tetratricopeptide (TPR) repeat protein